MRFGSVPTDLAEGAILAHAVKIPGRVFAKGRCLNSNDLAILADANVAEVVVACLDVEDVPEDEAASQIGDAIPAQNLRISPATTGRINVFATTNGLFVANRAVVDKLNRVDPAITLACLADHVTVNSGDMVATIKIIPFAVPKKSVEQAAAVARQQVPFKVKQFRSRRVALVATHLPSLKHQVMDKTRVVLAARLSKYGSTLATELRVPHDGTAVAGAIASLCRSHDLIVIFGASAVADPNDVIPVGIRGAGGIVEHVGMPIDPGNLLVLGRLNEIPIVGAPGCARSMKENGLDWILDRLLADEWPSSTDITGLGVGGLMKEIVTRPHPRESATSPRPVETVVLAAGSASRMGAVGPHKLLAEFDGVPLVRRSVQTALAAGNGRVVVVTGFREKEIRECLSDLPVTLVTNPNYTSGMASSLVAGLAVVDKEAGGVMVMLADMPGLEPEHLSKMIEAFKAEKERVVVRAVAQGQPGNPVILPRATFSAVQQLVGDVGARHIVEHSGLTVVDVEIGDTALLDVDTREAVIAAGGKLKL